jgi:hypothetical protein
MYSYVELGGNKTYKVTFRKFKCKQGYFCDKMCQNAIPEVLSQEDAILNGILEPFLDIDITPTLSDRILSHSLHSGSFFKRKIALTMSVSE